MRVTTTTAELIEEEKPKAWVLNFGAGVHAAVAFHEMSQVLLAPELHYVPKTPPHCNHVLIMRYRTLPVMNLANLFAPIAAPAQINQSNSEDNGIVGIAVYQAKPEAPLSYVGLHLESLPQATFVDDEDACELPENPLWEHIAVSCFYFEGRRIPLLDLTTLFSAQVREYIMENIYA
jgi:chemotaxis signal transduction protein